MKWTTLLLVILLISPSFAQVNQTDANGKKQGIWEKGDNKAWAYFVKMIGLPGYNISPREAVKVYESLTSI